MHSNAGFASFVRLGVLLLMLHLACSSLTLQFPLHLCPQPIISTIDRMIGASTSPGRLDKRREAFAPEKCVEI